MKKNLSLGIALSLIIVTALSLGIFMPQAKVKAQSGTEGLCQLVNNFITIGLIPADKANLARSSANCPLANIDGVCSNLRNACSVGTVVGTSTSSTTATTTYRWSCAGLSGGTTTACRKDIAKDLTPLYPVCGSATSSVHTTMPATSTLCSVGTVGTSYGATADGSNRWFWGCVGRNTEWQNDTTWCFAPKSAVACATTTYSVYGACVNGFKTREIATSSPVGCVASRTILDGLVGTCPMTGVCSTTRNNCTLGTATSSSQSTSTYFWSCVGINNGTTTPCQKSKPIAIGVCSETAGECTVGTVRTGEPSAANYLWSCVGINGGTTTPCVKAKPTIADPASGGSPITGVCGTTRNTCSSGSVASAYVSSSTESTTYTWRCSGANGGGSNPCTKTVQNVINGACGTSVDTCQAGTFMPDVDSTTQDLWRCIGANNGTTASCTKNKPTTVVHCKFDAAQYAKYYKDLDPTNATELKNHYLRYGINEGRTPCGYIMPECKFNASIYVNFYPDLIKAGVNGLTHYKEFGINESRDICQKTVVSQAPASENYATAAVGWDTILRLIQAMK